MGISGNDYANMKDKFGSKRLKITMGHTKIKIYASRAELDRFTLGQRDQSPGSGSESHDRRQLLLLLISRLQKQAL